MAVPPTVKAAGFEEAKEVAVAAAGSVVTLGRLMKLKTRQEGGISVRIYECEHYANL